LFSKTYYKIKIDKKESFKENKSNKTFLSYLSPNSSEVALFSVFSIFNNNSISSLTLLHIYNNPDFLCQKINKSLIWPKIK